jgi:hypothetical protein
VEIDAFLLGKRVPVLNPDTNQLAYELAALEPRCRILLAPLSSAQDCIQVESYVVNQLRKNPFTYDFLGNRDKVHKYNPKQSPIVRIASAPPIIGLTAPVPS